MFNIVLFGPPGSGKGTQSEKLIAAYQLKHISTGDILRSERANKTPLGIAAEGYMNKGQLVPDEVVIGMISSVIDANSGVKGFLFDGFPRTVAQAEALDALLQKKNAPIDIVLFLQVNEEELIKRLIGRAQTRGRSDDADPAVQHKRQDVYKNETLPVAAYYKKQNKVEDIVGEGSIDDIFTALSVQIDKKMK